MAVRKPKSDSASPSGSGRQRLQRVLAAAGLGSRRQCETFISEGRVEVDGEVVDRLGTTVDPQTSKIFVDGNRLTMPKLVYFLLHKPAGVVTTNRDPMGRTRVIDLIPPEYRVFPVGRLDRSSEGLILLTNDGDLADQLTHPRYGVMKVYHVTVAGQVNGEAMKKMKEGIFIAEGRVQVDGARIRKARPKATDMEITLREGKNREIRRILARLGHKVQTLRRVAIGPLRLGELPTGAYRPLTFQEIKNLKSETAAAKSRIGDASSVPRRATAKPKPKPKRNARVTSQHAANKTPVAKRSSAAKSEFHFERADDKPRAGAVIGAEPAPERPAKKSTKKAASKGGHRKVADRKPPDRKTSDRKTSDRKTSDRKPSAKRAAKPSVKPRGGNGKATSSETAKRVNRKRGPANKKGR